MWYKIKERWQLFRNDIEKASPGIYSEREIRRIFLSFLWQRLFHGTYMIDFIQYRFYERNKRGRKQFIEYQRLHKIMDKCNNPANNQIFDQKDLFNQKFHAYTDRDWMDLSSASFAEFQDFFKRNNRIFVKPQEGSFGEGIEVYSYDQVPDKELLFNKLKEGRFIAEKYLTQARELAEFNDSSLNTLRVVTLVLKNQEVKIMNAVLRLGRKGKKADNFHHEGIAALVDVETGIVQTCGVNRDYQSFVRHPDSGKVICGFQIPEWSKVKQLVAEMAQVLPDSRYVGWDIAIDEQYNVICVEGNRGADPDVTQVTDQKGKYYNYQKLI